MRFALPNSNQDQFGNALYPPVQNTTRITYLLMQEMMRVLLGNVQTVTAGTTTLDDTYGVILADATAGNVILNLPTAANPANSGSGLKWYFVKRIDGVVANSVTINAYSGQTIDGLASRSLVVQWAGMSLVADGSNFFIIGVI